MMDSIERGRKAVQELWDGIPSRPAESPAPRLGVIVDVPADRIGEHLVPRMPEEDYSAAEGLGRQAAERVNEAIVEVVCGRTEDSVETHRRCPLCWGGRRGVGLAYNTRGKPPSLTLRTRYYKCDRCSHTWSVMVDHRIVSVDFQVPGEIDTR